MPQNWKTYSIEEIAKSMADAPFGSNLKTKDYIEDGIPVVQGKNINGRSCNWSDNRFVSRDKFESLKRHHAKLGSLVFPKVGTIGKIGLLTAYNEGKDYLLSTNTMTLEVDPKIASKDFVYYYFTTPDIINHIQASNSNSVQPVFNFGSLKQYPINLPPLPEQQAIAQILSSLDNKIELNLQMNKTLEEMAMTLYKHWFVDFGPFKDGKFIDSALGPIPEGWEVKRLDSLVKFSNGYAFKSTQLLKEEEEDCLHVFKMGHIQKGGGLKPNGTKSWIKRSNCSGLDKYILKVGDILMSMTDMKDNMTILGHTALMNENEKYIVNQRVGLLRVNNDLSIDYPFIYILTNSTDYIERLRSQANSGVQVNLSTDAIKSSLVITPTKEINDQFNSIVLPLFEQISQNSIENQTLTALRDTLLPKLISGEVRVKDVQQTVAEAV